MMKMESKDMDEHIDVGCYLKSQWSGRFLFCYEHV